LQHEGNIAGTYGVSICHNGVPVALLSNNANFQIGKDLFELLRMYAIKDFQREPHHQPENYADRPRQGIKKHSNTLLECSVSPPSFLLLCVQFFVNRKHTLI
jgi:hypothetical protein